MSDKTMKITFANMDKTVEVEAGKAFDQDGEEGSILQIALENGIEIDHACGGVCACSTCHVVVTKGFDDCNEPTDDELDQLDNAPGLQMESRLACQCIPNGEGDLTVEIPSWNRNRVPSEH